MKKLFGSLMMGTCFAASLLAQAPGAARDRTSRTEEFVIRYDDGTVESFARSHSAFAPQAACTVDATTLCLLAGRFRVRVSWHAVNLGTSGVGAAVPVTSDTGYFWFFTASNVELVIKVLDGRAFNNAFWVFYGALSDVAYTITVTDLVTGAVKTYTNPQGTLASVADTSAFPSLANCSYSLSSTSVSVGAASGPGTVGVTAPSGCLWIATSNDSWITINSGTPGNGNGTVAFTAAANSGSGPRTGTLTVAGQTLTVSQAGSNAGIYNGNWTGTTSQAKAINFTIASDAFSTMGFDFRATGACFIDGGTTQNFLPTRGFTGDSFSISVTGEPPFMLSFTAAGTFNSPTTASGTLSFSITESAPFTPCAVSGSATWTATKN